MPVLFFFRNATCSSTLKCFANCGTMSRYHSYARNCANQLTSLATTLSFFWNFLAALNS